ncbi:hypothetical protein [Geodermatophilus siccatus]|nr:hypothetical protein [Geodermatophilus siccatus]
MHGTGEHSHRTGHDSGSRRQPGTPGLVREQVAGTGHPGATAVA